MRTPTLDGRFFKLADPRRREGLIVVGIKSVGEQAVDGLGVCDGQVDIKLLISTESRL